MDCMKNAAYTAYNYTSSTLLYDALDPVEKKDNGNIVKRVLALSLPILELNPATKVGVAAVTPIFKILSLAEAAGKEIEGSALILKSFEIAVGWIAFFSVIFAYIPGIALYAASRVASDSVKITNCLLEGKVEKALDKSIKLIAKTAALAAVILGNPTVAIFAVSFKICFAFYQAKSEASQGRIPECISKIALLIFTKQTMFFGEAAKA